MGAWVQLLDLFLRKGRRLNSNLKIVTVKKTTDKCVDKLRLNFIIESEVIEEF
jgi:hypothetical protein